MTTADLDRKSAVLERLRGEWAKIILPSVSSKLEDAQAHAERAVTRRGKGGAVGPPTRSPAFASALRRLDDLRTHLAGPKPEDLRGRIRDAREGFYRQAHAIHRGMIPASLHVTENPRPTRENIALIRMAPIHGYDPHDELRQPFDEAKRRLATAVAMAAQHDDVSILDPWYNQSVSMINGVVLRLLSDSVEHADTEAGRDLIHPRFLVGRVG